MQQVDLKSALNMKDFFIKKELFIFYLKAQIEFQVINSDNCDWWIENYMRSDWLKEVHQVNFSITAVRIAYLKLHLRY